MIETLIETPSPPLASILFISETRFGEKTFSEIERLTPSLIPNLPSNEKIERQLLRVFLGTHFPRLREKRLAFSGYQQFKKWFTDNRTTLDPQPILPNKSKKNRKTIPTALENACKSTDLCSALYEELCLLAPHRKYNTHTGTSNILKSTSHFNINIYVDLSIIKQIESILAIYRRWMIKNNEINLALSDLAILLASPSKTVSKHKRYTHIIWNSKQKISPNIRNFLNDLADEIINLPPQEQPKITSKITKSTVTMNIAPAIESESDGETSTLNDANDWNEYAQELSNDILSSDPVEFDKDLLLQPDIIRALLSDKGQGKEALRKILTAEPQLATSIIYSIASLMDVSVSFINFITHEMPNNLGKSILTLLCQPENHQFFLDLLYLQPKAELHHYWGIIKSGFKKIQPNKNDNSLFFHLLKTIDGIAVINRFIQVANDALRDFLEKSSQEFLSQTFSARTIHFTLGTVPHTVLVSPFSDLLNASKFVDLEHNSENTPGKPEEIETLITTIIFLATNSKLENAWSNYMRQIYASIIVCLANYMKNFPLGYWKNITFNFPWEYLISLAKHCQDNLEGQESQDATTTLFEITLLYSTEHLLKENTLTKAHLKILDSKNYSKTFYSLTISYLLSVKNSCIKDFVEKAIHPDRYLTFNSIIEHADIIKPEEDELFSTLLIYLIDYIRKTFALEYMVENTSMYIKIISMLSYKQEVISISKPESTAKEFIFNLATVLMEELPKPPCNDLHLYDETLRVIQNNQVKQETLKKLFILFREVHNTILMPLPYSPKNYNLALNLYHSFMIIIFHTNEPYHCYKLSMETYLMANNYYSKPGNPLHPEWHSTIYLYAWMMNTSGIAMIGKDEKFLDPHFFTEVFNFSSQHVIKNDWSRTQKNRILNIYTDFFLNSVQYLLTNKQSVLPLGFCWEKLNALFNRETFGYLKENDFIISKMINVMELYKSNLSYDVSKLNTLLSEIRELREELENSHNKYENISINQHPSTLFGMQPHREVSVNRGSYYETGTPPDETGTPPNVDELSISVIMTTNQTFG